LLVQHDCILCRIASHDPTSAIAYEDNEIMAIMDLYPASKGHLLVLPKQHFADIFEMSAPIGAHIMSVVLRLAKAAQRVLAPDGLNLVQANGTKAGQTIHHFHLHVIPRYTGDAIVLQFGHGVEPANSEELRQLASLLRSASLQS
jgi:histidine triad (HIT) family protein